MRRRVLALLVGSCACLAGFEAMAQSYEAVYDDASRVRHIEYRENLVLKVVGYADHPMVIELNPDETIDDTAGGAIANWEVVKRQARLYVRPLPEARPATIVMATKTRSYVLDLVPGKETGIPRDFVSKIIVTYPPPPPKADEKAQKTAKESSPLKEALQSTTRNERYSLEAVSETIDIRPREVFDDGRFTYFRYPENLPVPAIYKSTPGSKEEWLVNSHRDGDYIVLHGVGAAWNLRLSGSLLGVFNDAYDPVGLAPANDTTLDGLRRVMK